MGPPRRLFLAKATGHLQLRQADGGGGGGERIFVVPAAAGDGALPRFLPDQRAMRLPRECENDEVFEARLRHALGLHGEYATAAPEGAEQAQRLVRVLGRGPDGSAQCHIRQCEAGHRWVDDGRESGGGGGDECPECSDRASTLCCVCLSAPKSALLLPCRHLCLCDDCADQACAAASHALRLPPRLPAFPGAPADEQMPLCRWSAARATAPSAGPTSRRWSPPFSCRALLRSQQLSSSFATPPPAAIR